jgi:hypothetical protein
MEADLLIQGVERLRELALQARDLAELTHDPLARAGLQEHAADLEQHAAGVAAQLVTMIVACEPSAPKSSRLRRPQPKPVPERAISRSRRRRRG